MAWQATRTKDGCSLLVCKVKLQVVVAYIVYKPHQAHLLILDDSDNVLETMRFA